MALDITDLVVNIKVNREHVTPEDEENARRLNEALQQMANACLEVSGTLTAAGRRYMEAVATAPDEAPGMTLEELIPETIDEWKRIRDEGEQ